MTKPARFVFILLGVVVLVNLLLLFFYYSKEKKFPLKLSSITLLPGNRKGTFEVSSEDSNVQVKLTNTSLLEEYANDFELFKDARLGKLEGPNSINWYTVNKLFFVYQPKEHTNIELENKNTPILTFDVEAYEGSKTATIYFDYLPLRDRSYYIEDMDKVMSSVIVRLLYRVTHYMPRKQYKGEELDKIIEELYKKEPIVDVNVSFEE